jgi:hypothetical protein
MRRKEREISTMAMKISVINNSTMSRMARETHALKISASSFMGAA